MLEKGHPLQEWDKIEESKRFEIMKLYTKELKMDLFPSDSNKWYS